MGNDLSFTLKCFQFEYRLTKSYWIYCAANMGPLLPGNQQTTQFSVFLSWEGVELYHHRLPALFSLWRHFVLYTWSQKTLVGQQKTVKAFFWEKKACQELLLYPLLILWRPFSVFINKILKKKRMLSGTKNLNLGCFEITGVYVTIKSRMHINLKYRRSVIWIQKDIFNCSSSIDSDSAEQLEQLPMRFKKAPLRNEKTAPPGAHSQAAITVHLPIEQAVCFRGEKKYVNTESSFSFGVSRTWGCTQASPHGLQLTI